MGKATRKGRGQCDKIGDRILKLDLFGWSAAFEKVAVVRLGRLVGMVSGKGAGM